MITQIDVTNFKLLKQASFSTRPLNLLTGLNGSGKSTLLQVLLLLRQSRLHLPEGKLYLKPEKDQLLNAGLGTDICSESAEQQQISIALHTNTDNHFSWLFPVQKDEFLQSENIYGTDGLQNCILFREATRDFETINGKARIKGIHSPFQYLCTDRLPPLEDAGDGNFARSSEAILKLDLGARGQYTINFLYTLGHIKLSNDCLLHLNAKSEFFLHQTEAWLSEISPDVSLEIEPINDEQLNLKYKFKGSSIDYKPKHVGFGLSYALPVIVALLSAQKNKIILIENPETHIHPRGQVELGRLIAKAAQSGAQLFIETHSDHILNGIRIACKEQDINPNNATAFFFKRNQELNQADITQIIFDTKGKMFKYENGERKTQIPKGFFDQWTTSMAKLF